MGEPRVESRTVVDAACVDRRIKLGGGVSGGRGDSWAMF